MILNIVSKYILEFIFSLTEDKRRLEIIIYNKELQDKLNININHYKGLSQKKLIIDNNGIGKIYDIFSEEKYFEGEYLNKKKNGKGIEFKFGRKIYEGEYKNGKRNGFGRLYNEIYEKPSHEGEFKDGKKNGFGKEYDFKSCLRFEGEFKNDRYWNGILIQRLKNKKILFEGLYVNGKIWNGKGYKTYNNEIDYEITNGNGKFKIFDEVTDNLFLEINLINGELNGNGKMYKILGGGLEYEGKFLNLKKNGKGKEYYSNGKIKFDGIFKGDKKWEGKGYNINGHLEYELKDGNGKFKDFDDDGTLKFEGEIKNGEKNGFGRNLFEDSISFEGSFLKGKKNGYGKEYEFGKLIYEGNFYNDKRHGKGKLYTNDAKIKFEGIFLYGLEIIKNGSFKTFDKQEIKVDDIRKIYIGESKSGKSNGHGKEYIDGYLNYEGEYLNGEKNGYGKSYHDNGIISSEGYYENGLKNGYWKKYYENGNLKCEGIYVKGKKNEIWKGYYENGKFNYEYYYRDGNKVGIQKVYYENGKLDYEGEYLDKKIHGKGKKYDENGKLIFEGEYKDGNKWNGINKIYNYNGKLRIDEILKNGEKIISKEYNDSGNIISIREYSNEKKSELGKDYYNGVLIFEGEYKKGRRNGKGIEYDYNTGHIIL